MCHTSCTSLVVTLLTLVALPSLAAVSRSSPSTLEGSVVQVVDATTVQVRVGDRVERVRYLGVVGPLHAAPTRTTPAPRRPAAKHDGAAFAHSRAAAEAAMRINVQLVSGKSVRLELEPPRRDPAGRLRAHVWVGDTLVSAELVERGYAQVAGPPTRHNARLRALEDDARRAGRGLWTTR